MNFKKYHVSKNLFDGEYPNISGTIQYRALNLGNGTYTLSSTVEISPGSAGTLFFLAGNVSSGASTATNAVYKDNPITVTTTNGYITIAYRTYGIDTPFGKETMLNEGSTPLPYEPYSSEVWHDLTQHIMSTTWQDGSTYSRSGGSWPSSLTKKRSLKKK